MARLPNPPRAVAILMELVGIFLRPDILPKRISWQEALRLLKDPHLLNKLLQYDKDGITTEQLAHAASYMTRPEMQPDHMMKVSLAASNLLTWTRAMYLYGQSKHQTTSN